MTFKVGDRVRFHMAGTVGAFGTVARVCDGAYWVRYDSGRHWPTAPWFLLPAPRYEQCGCEREGYVAWDDSKHIDGSVCCPEHIGSVHSNEQALAALTAGLRALHAATNSAPISSEPAPAESTAARDVAQEAECRWHNNSLDVAYCGTCPQCLSAGSDAQTESECGTGPRVRLVESYTIPKRAPVCEDCGASPAELRDAYRDGELMGPERAKRVLCVYCGDRLDPKKYFKRGEGGPGITPPPPPVVDEDGEVWATATGEWP